MYPIVFIIAVLFSTQNKYENGRLFAVNMKKEWIKDATVADIQAKIQKGNALLRHSPCDCSICKPADLPYVHSAYHLDILASGSDFSAFPADHACESPVENMENTKSSVRRPAAGTLCGIKTGWLRKKSPVSPDFSCQISSVLQVPCCCFQSPAGLGFPV